MTAVPCFLPASFAEAPSAPLLLNRAILLAKAEGITCTECIFPLRLAERAPKHYLRLLAEAARLGLTAREGVVPDGDSPFVFYAGGRTFDLRLPEGLHDWHAHTQFAYCGRGIELFDATELAFSLGIQSQGYSEHTFALYFPGDALKFYWQSDPEFVERVWAEPGRGRMVAYKQLVAEARKHLGPRVRFGLEVDLFGGGRFCLAPEDTDGWDMLIGAIHEVEGVTNATPQAEAEVAWMRDVERLISNPIKILAHPFRYWPWGHRPVPRDLYKPVARLLKEKGIAAEINHHKNPFELEFFRICLEEGVMLSLGSDAHITRDIANLHPHLRTLNELGLNTPELRAKHLLK